MKKRIRPVKACHFPAREMGTCRQVCTQRRAATLKKIIPGITRMVDSN